MLGKIRAEAKKASDALPLPTKNTAGWRYTDISWLDLTRYSPKPGKIAIEGEGAVIRRLNDALEHETHAERYLLSKKDEDDKFSAFHKASFDDGVFIHVKKGEKAKVNATFEARPGLQADHTLIVLEQGAMLDYFEEHRGDGALRLDYVEIYLGPGSTVNFHNHQHWSGTVNNIASWKAFAGRDAAINWYFAQLGGNFSRIKIDTYFEGDGSSSLCKGLVYGRSSQAFDITTNPHHKALHTTSDVLVKGAFAKDSSSVYRGLIGIDKQAKFTNSYLSNHNLMLGEGARVHTIPGLMIETDEVKASHGATLGKIDKEQLFYLMSRGIGRQPAEALLIEAFISEVLDCFGDSAMRKKILAGMHDEGH